MLSLTNVPLYLSRKASLPFGKLMFNRVRAFQKARTRARRRLKIEAHANRVGSVVIANVANEILTRFE